MPKVQNKGMSGFSPRNAQDKLWIMLSSRHLSGQDRFGIGTFQTKDEKNREEPFHKPR